MVDRGKSTAGQNNRTNPAGQLKPSLAEGGPVDRGSSTAEQAVRDR